MTDKNGFERAARLLSSEQKEDAMRSLLEHADEPEAGIMRQLLADPKQPLTEKQQYVYDNHILPSMVEKCGNKSCHGFSLSGVEYCDTCGIEFG